MQVDYYVSRCKRFPDHPKFDWMQGEIKRLTDEVEKDERLGPSKPDRLMNRVDTLVQAIVKTKAFLADGSAPKAALRQAEKRLTEYQESISNIQTFGKEKPSSDEKNAVKIEVPTHIMEREVKI